MKEDVSSAQITTIIVLSAEMNIFQEILYVLMSTFKLLLLLKKKKKRKKKLDLLQQIKAQSQSRRIETLVLFLMKMKFSLLMNLKRIDLNATNGQMHLNLLLRTKKIMFTVLMHLTA